MNLQQNNFCFLFKANICRNQPALDWDTANLWIRDDVLNFKTGFMFEKHGPNPKMSSTRSFLFFIYKIIVKLGSNWPIDIVHRYNFFVENVTKCSILFDIILFKKYDQ